MPIVCLDVWESVSGNNGLGGNSSDGTHGKTSVQKFAVLLLLQSIGITGCECVPCKVTGFTFSLHGGDRGGGRDDQIPKSNPKKQLAHGSGFQESIMGIHGLGDGLEGVHLTGDTDEIGGDETNHSQHGGTSVTDFALTEPWHEGFVCLTQLKLYCGCWYGREEGVSERNIG